MTLIIIPHHHHHHQTNVVHNQSLIRNHHIHHIFVAKTKQRKLFLEHIGPKTLLIYKESKSDNSKSAKGKVSSNLCSKVIEDSDLSHWQSEATVKGVPDLSQPKMATPMITQSGKMKHFCVRCQKSFDQTGQLKRHMHTHNGVKAHTCSECRKSFSQAEHLKTHMITHSRERAYNCVQC